jgi:hypothetical protein
MTLETWQLGPEIPTGETHIPWLNNWSLSKSGEWKEIQLFHLRGNVHMADTVIRHRFIRYHVDPLICVHCHIDPLNSMMTPNCCYRATPLLLNQQCIHECCVQSDVSNGQPCCGRAHFQWGRERSRARVCLCVCHYTCHMTVIYQVYQRSKP